MIYSADVSKYQVQVNNQYTRQWLIIRCCDGNTFDQNAVGNADWCRGAVAQGLMVGWTAYVVYRPGLNAAVIANLKRILPLDRVMIDIESWGGQITGNHAAEINALAASIGQIVGPTNVWVYGNAGDLNSIDPGRTQLTVVAAYGTKKPALPNMIGWQYTNGQTVSGSRPLSSAPFGACDHNELYVDELSPSGGGVIIGGNVTTPAQDAAAVWATPVPVPTQWAANGSQSASFVLSQCLSLLTVLYNNEASLLAAVNAIPGEVIAALPPAGSVDVNALAAALAPLIKAGASKQDVVDAITETIKIGAS